MSGIRESVLGTARSTHSGMAWWRLTCSDGASSFATVPDLTLELHFTPGQMLAYYRGQARSVQARATTGQMVQFPAGALQKMVTPDGVHGVFRIEFDENHKFIRLVRVS